MTSSLLMLRQLCVGIKGVFCYIKQTVAVLKCCFSPGVGVDGTEAVL